MVETEGELGLDHRVAIRRGGCSDYSVGFIIQLGKVVAYCRSQRLLQKSLSFIQMML
jgi:hypothetical protein